MRKWSENLINLSREYMEIDGVHLKSLDGDFGILNIDSENKLYKIQLKDSDQVLIFNSADEMIDAGWAVD
jgi:hypothetical protein